jgi:hypothetical protein
MGYTYKTSDLESFGLERLEDERPGLERSEIRKVRGLLKVRRRKVRKKWSG